MKLSQGNVFNLKRGEIKVFYGEITLDHDDTIRALISCPGKAECISNEGLDYLGAWFDKLDKKAKAGVPKRLWFYVKAPDAEGKYNGTIEIINAARKTFAKATIVLNVSSEAADADQFKNADELTRLFWLNSSLAQDAEVPKPYIPVTYENGTVKILGREIELDEYGLPKRICSHFDKDGKLSTESYEVLSDKVKFTVGEEKFNIISSGANCEGDVFSFSSVSESDNLMMKTTAKIEFDGFCDYKISLIAKRGVKLSNVNLCLPVSEYSRKYFMGLGERGGCFNEKLDFKWNQEKNQDNFWVGNINSGIRVKFKDENYKKPLVDNYYRYKPLIMPKSWDNEGRGGIRFENGSFVAYSGNTVMRYGEKLTFNFKLLLTPVKPLSNGCESRKIEAPLDYSLKEFSAGEPEYSAFLDFDNELLEAPVPTLESAALCNGESRICNFLVEKLNYLAKHHKIDELRLNGAVVDRNTIKRVRKILDKADGSMIKLRADNQFTEDSGYANALLTYAELLPFVDKLTLDDEPKKSSDFRLVELSGIPFGIENEAFKSFKF